jgi:hypothetical protein
MRLRLLIVIASFVGAALVASVDARADEFVFVRNTRNAATAITPTQAKEMAIGKRKVWPQGAVVLLVLTHPGTPALAWLATRVCGVDETALMSKIKQEVFKGELRKPIFVASDKEIADAVAAEDGAIGIVHADFARTLPAGVATLALK